MNTWQAEEAIPPRPPAGAPEQIRYLHSYLTMRIAIGLLALALPVVLLAGDAFFLEGDILPRGSLSAYYHSGMRDVFVAALCATGIFLITYKVVERNLDNTLSIISGVAVLCVAIFPTGLPSVLNGARPTPLQERFHEGPISAIHAVSATIFMLTLAAMSYYFGKREGARKHDLGQLSPGFWMRFHWACAGTIAVSVAFIGLTKLTHTFDEYSALIGETVAVAAFGLSWLAKGSELARLSKRSLSPSPDGSASRPPGRR